MTDRQFLLDEKPATLIKKLSLPAIMGMMVISVNSLIDAIYLGNLVSAEAFAGVSALFPVTLVVGAMNGFIAAGAGSLLSRSIGAEDVATQKTILSHVLTLSVLSTVILMISGYLGSDAILSLLGLTGEVSVQAESYLLVFLVGIFFNIYGLSANGLIRSEGRVKYAMRVTMISVVLNLILTPVFIVLGDLGVAGAAWSSVVTMMIYTALTTYYFASGKATFQVGKISLRIRKDIFRKISSIGISAFAMQSANVARQFIIIKTITWYGTTHDLIIYSAIFRLFSFVSIPVLGLLQPLQPIIGVNFGARVWDRCISNLSFFRTTAVVVAIAFFVILILFAEFFLKLMIPGEPVYETDLYLLRITMFSLPFFPFASSAIIFYQATGNGRKASLLPLAKQLIFFLPVIFTMPWILGISGVYYAITLDHVLYGITLFFLMRTELIKMKNMDLTAL